MAYTGGKLKARKPGRKATQQARQSSKFKLPIVNAPHLAALNIFATYNLLSRVMSKHLSEFNLTISQHSVLAFLKANAQKGLALNSIGELLSLSSPNITSVVDRLEEKGLVVRTDHDTDRRIKIIKLTPAGEELERRVFEVHGQRIEGMLHSLGKKDLEDLIRLLRKARHGLEESGWLNRNSS